jgi:3-mercaptopyruvate sulfurtransferase SseA/sterol desaturase/sphingolipid hydroxylase (fatty acid hydroxylase superfamily)
MNWIKKSFTIVSALLLSALTFAQNGDQPMISIDKASALIESEDVKFIDVRIETDYATGHVPGAINIWRPQITDPSYDFGGMMASKMQMESLLSELGIEPQDELILYDDRGNCEAARLWWVLNRYGHEDVKLMDGGILAWKARDLEISLEPAYPVASNYAFQGQGNESWIATKEDVLNAVENEDVVIIDTRERDEFTGEYMKDGAKRAGRIPGSVWINWSEAVDYQRQERLKPADQLQKLFEQRGIYPETPIITYCQSGVRSAHTTWVLTQVLGFKNVKNYDGSWREWSADPSLPIETGDPSTAQQMASVDEKAGKPDYGKIFVDATKSFAQYTWNEITFKVKPWYINYFWWLVVLSLAVWLLEIFFPWRKDQPIIRKDFWLDTFYMFFNFYIFKIIIFFAFSSVVYTWFDNLVGGVDRLVIYDTKQLHPIVQLIVFFVLVDFIQWFTHVLLHRYEFLWKFHKVHHSVEQMGYAAHLRFHWMENVFYTPMKFIMMMVIGNFSPQDAFIVYYASIAIGHLNHANIKLSYGPLKYILNNPEMHIWHHSYYLPKDRRKGVNFGISLSLWDYIFGTAYIPESGRDIKLGFPKMESFPHSFWGQLVVGWVPDRWLGKKKEDKEKSSVEPTME